MLHGDPPIYLDLATVETLLASDYWESETPLEINSWVRKLAHTARRALENEADTYAWLQHWQPRASRAEGQLARLPRVRWEPEKLRAGNLSLTERRQTHPATRALCEFVLRDTTPEEEALWAWVLEGMGAGMHGEGGRHQDVVFDLIFEHYNFLRRLMSVTGPEEVSIPMILHCPHCHAQHVDAPEPQSGWTNPPHRTHLCHACERTWRPAQVATTGVRELPSVGRTA